MQQVQLYIEGQRVDMFKDESVVITDTLKDVKDISKIFTEYSQTFQIPASRINNKVFKHYYNNDIMEGFDARVRATARIELNSLPFKDGYIKLEGVDLKNNKAHTYRITFFGNTVSLKELLGDDSLSDLNWLDNFSEEDNGNKLTNNALDIEDYLSNEKSRTIDGVTYSSPLQIPLLTHTQRLLFNSTENIRSNGNLHYTSTFNNSSLHGVNYTQLKYAIKLEIIIKAIEEQYGFTFSNDFFGGANSFRRLYMWLHRNKGKVATGSQAEEYKSFVSGWANASGSISSMNSNTFTLNSNQVDVFFVTLEPTTIDQNKKYSVAIWQNGSIVYQSSLSSGNKTLTPPKVIGEGYTVEVTSSEELDFASIEWTARIVTVSTDTFETTSFDVKEEFLFNIQQQIPEMKILDFLTSVFNMFSLVAFFEGDVLVVKSLDDFYSLGRGGNLNSEDGFDITKYVDVSEKQVDVALPFREINYSYKGLKTFLAKEHNQIFNEEWGTEKYGGENEDTSRIFSEGIFKVQVGFEHMKFERLIDLNTPANPTLTDIQWGFCVDDNQDSYVGDPIVFYMKRETLSSNERISFVNQIITDNDGVETAQSRIPLSSYYLPVNSDLYFSQEDDRQTINFNAAPDEWTLQTTEQSLFNNYHKNYISSVFAKSNRLTTITAYLPLRILLKYNLADRFIVSGSSYKINSIETDFYTGKSSIELLNDI